jgi:outer membrane immunogenic protein
MRRFAIAFVTAVSMIALAQIASATPYNWTGFYVGGNIGYSWGKADTEATSPDLAVVVLGGVTNVPGGSFFGSTKLNGWIGGTQIGYNFQFGNWLAGIETDLQASGEKGDFNQGVASSIAGTCCTSSSLVISETSAASYEAKISWFGTVRGRFGWASNGLLLYGTGGLAYGRVNLSGTTTLSGTITCVANCVLGPPGGERTSFASSVPFGASAINAGWTIGGGLEGAVPNMSNLTWKVEYLHIDLGSLDLAATTAGVSAHAKFIDDIARVGVNYHF